MAVIGSLRSSGLAQLELFRMFRYVFARFTFTGLLFRRLTADARREAAADGSVVFPGTVLTSRRPGFKLRGSVWGVTFG